MTELHYGFRVLARHGTIDGQQEESFEVRSAAQEHARRLDERGWCDVRCAEVIAVPNRFGTMLVELRDIEWQIHIVGVKA